MRDKVYYDQVVQLYSDHCKAMGWRSALSYLSGDVTDTEVVLRSKYNVVLARYDRVAMEFTELHDFDSLEKV